MKYKNVRVVRMPVIHDDYRHYFLNGDTGFCGVLAEDLPRATLPINSIIDDMIEQQNPDVVTCDYCDCGIDPDSSDAVVLADGNYCDVFCFNRAPCEFCNASSSDCHCFDG